MEKIVKLALAVIVVWIAWGIITHLLGGLVHLAVQVALLALACYLVMLVYRAMTRQRI